VWVLRASIDFKIPELSAPKWAARQHSLHREADDILGMTIAEFTCGRALETTDETGVTIIDFIAPLFTGERYFLSVYYDHIVTVIDVWSEGGLMLTTEDVSDLRRRTTEDLALKIDDPPLAVLDRFSDWS